MYQLKSILGIKFGYNAEWETFDEKDLPISTIFKSLRKAYFVVENPIFNQEQYVDFEFFRKDYGSLELTVTDILDSLGTASLPTQDKPNLGEVKYATYRDFSHAGYKLDLVNTKRPYTDIRNRSELVDLKLYRTNPKTDMGSFYKSCLVSVNGFYHQTDSDGEYVYVYDGGVSLHKTKYCQLGVLSFSEIGNIKIVPIARDMIVPSKGEYNYYDKVNINLNQDLTNKSVFFVLGGYLGFLDGNVITRTGDDSFCIKLKNNSYLERFHESFHELDYSALELPDLKAEPTLMTVAQLTHNNTIIRYLMMKQTFAVVVDTPNLFTEDIHIAPSPGIPGNFRTKFEPKLPLLVGHGRTREYTKEADDYWWELNAFDARRDRYVFETIENSRQTLTTNQRVPIHTFSRTGGKLLAIGSFK